MMNYENEVMENEMKKYYWIIKLYYMRKTEWKKWKRWKWFIESKRNKKVLLYFKYKKKWFLSFLQQLQSAAAAVKICLVCRLKVI